MPKNKIYVEFEPDTGAITGQYQQHTPLVPIEGRGVIEVDEAPRFKDHYVSEGQVVERKSFNVPNTQVSGSFEMTLPIGAEAKWLDEWYTVDDGLLELTLDQVGTFPLVLKHPHFKTRLVTLENN